ncbi:DUF7289 family protein [Haloparvum alkalitolerans]|uniref:DUF7289 family protein n=1 Tax=Haloparvum alkalitolerans TaxID=1042953 RepID=UPI003CF409B0
MEHGRERAQSEPIGVILVLGISLAVILVSVGIGSALVTESTSDVETERMENGMSQFGSKASLVALGESGQKRVPFGQLDSGDVTVDGGSGSVTIHHRVNGSLDEIHNTTLGAVVYENDGDRVAYQGGGVWSVSDGRSRMISPPEYHYRSSTLTFPIVRVTGNDTASGSAAARISSDSVGQPIYPNGSYTNPLDEGVIVVEVQSDYYEGWAQFFRQRAEGEVTVHDANRTVVAELVVPEDLTVNNAVSAQQNYNENGNAGTDDRVEEGEPLPGVDGMLQDEVNDASASNDNDQHSCIDTSGISAGCTLTAGTYYIDGDATLGGDLNINTSAGDVNIVTKGDFDIGGNDVEVVDGSDNGVTYYVNGSLKAQGGAWVGTSAASVDADRNVFLVGDQVVDDSTGGGNIQFDAVIYAPDANIDTNGNLQFNGALYANDIDVGGNVQIDYDEESLVEFQIELTSTENTITYLHISENTVEVELE